jgi:integrase
MAEALHALRGRGCSIKTSNLYLDAVKQFVAWLVQDKRLGESPLAHLSGGNVQLDRRHDRRALTFDELVRVLQAARASESTFRGLAGADRHVLYVTACVTGYRASELACLTPTSFALDADPPLATVPSGCTKNKRLAMQPLLADVAEMLREHLRGRPSDHLVWPGTWFEKAAEMLHADLDAAGIPYMVEGPDGPLYADFHALRHSYIALLDRTGATLKEAMQLARHSDPKLTMAIYGRAPLHDLGGVVQRMPSLLSGGDPEAEALRATGTTGPRRDESFRPACATADGGGVPMTAIESTGRGKGQNANRPQPLDSTGV